MGFIHKNVIIFGNKRKSKHARDDDWMNFENSMLSRHTHRRQAKATCGLTHLYDPPRLIYRVTNIGSDQGWHSGKVWDNRQRD